MINKAQAIFLSLILILLILQPSLAQKQGRIDHIFIIQKNHSFDNYFGTYPGANGFPSGIVLPVDSKQDR